MCNTRLPAPPPPLSALRRFFRAWLQARSGPLAPGGWAGGRVLFCSVSRQGFRMGEGARAIQEEEGKLITLGKGIRPSNHSPHQPKAGGDRAGRRAGVPPGAAHVASAHLCFPAWKIGPNRSSAAKGEPGWAGCSVVSNGSHGGGEPLGGCCRKGAAHFTGQFPRDAGPGRSSSSRADRSIFRRARPLCLSFGSRTMGGHSGLAGCHVGVPVHSLLFLTV